MPTHIMTHALQQALPTIALTLAALWAFWLLYVFTMGLYRAFLSGRLRGLPLVMAAPVVALAAVVDLLMQLTIFTLVFLDPPRHWLVTYRLRHYMAHLPPAHWRRRWADRLCHHLLDPYDPTGSHCDDAPPTLKT